MSTKTIRPAVVNVTRAAKLMGISPSYAYQLIREDRFPIQTLKIGTKSVVPVDAILTFLGLDELPQEAA